jgi:hypothetical protein
LNFNCRFISLFFCLSHFSLYSFLIFYFY